MKKSLLFMMLIAVTAIGFSQSFPGYSSGNYTGVNGVFFNPANIADSRYRWDFNLIGIHAGVGNNNASFSIKNIGDAFGKDLDSVLFGSSAKNTSALANIDVFGPSVLFNINSKTSLALTTRVRTLANIKDLDGKLIQSIDNNLSGSLPLTLSSDANQKIVVNGWADFGVSLGQVLYNENKHFLKGGVTLKYLAGVANTHANISNFTGTADEDVFGDTYITNASGAVSVGISGVNISDDFEASDLTKFKSSGFGADIGFAYEYRPYGDVITEKYPNKYKYKIALSLMDMGTIKYTPDANRTGSYSVNISNVQKWYPQDLEGKSIEEIKTYLDGSPYFTNLAAVAASYKASLPTNIQFGIDYNVHKGLYVALNGQLNAAKKEDKYSAYYNNNISLIPRYEGRGFGVSVPLTYNELSSFTAGVSLRVGPVFIGSGSILSALTSKSKQADLHFGLRFGGLKKKDKVPVKTTTVVEETVYKKKVVKRKASKKEDEKETPKAADVKQVTETKVEIIKVMDTVKVAAADTDGDGILDINDKCPGVAGLFVHNGCPVPDTDGDGVNDEMDSCKTIPGSIKYHGCAIPDTDGDGVNDELDKCVTTAGLMKYSGCPIPDTDGDGVNDELDECLTVAGSAKYKGCPVPDTDNDGVNDDEDKCPGLAGDKANFGCPQIKKETIKKEEPANIKKDVLKKISTAAKGLQFATGKSVILKKSFVQLDNVVKVLKADPELTLEINGYTDNVGSADKNLQLSKDRANAAKAYLVKKGIDESRITADGFGAENPVAPNKTAAGRLKNRRVEFILNK
ncbi:DUF5723 family protein [Ferruginibacter sp. SUN002]|uniref:DUF5723 family protein n=1 Tax=Ferruginibacter sp. SUN002 TaxID=2937789 RepID=UPI003D367288